MKKIGKISTLLCAVLFAVMILMPMINQAHAGVQEWSWSGYVYRGYDSYYDYTVIAYLNDTEVTLKIPVYNNAMGPSANITAVSLVFDTGYNLTLSKVVNITLYETKYFDFNFTAGTNKFSNLWAHTYTIHVDMQSNAGTKYDDYWVYQWDSFYPYYKFAVYLPDQKDVVDLSREYNSYYSSYPPYNFQAVEARLLATQAGAEASIAQDFVILGNFTEAKSHYQTAVNLYEQAFDSEQEKGAAMEDATLDKTVKEGAAAEKTADAAATEADAAMAEAEAATTEAQAIMNQSYGHILVGIGFLLIGVGAMVYGIRKPKAN
jgi:hypothetical protein